MFIRFIVLTIPTLLIVLGCGNSISARRGGNCDAKTMVGVYTGLERARAVSFSNDKIVSLMTDAEKEAAKAAPPAPKDFNTRDSVTNIMGDIVTQNCTKQIIDRKDTRYEIKFAFVGEKCPVKVENATVTNIDAKGKTTSADDLFVYEVLSKDFAELNNIVQVQYTKRGTESEMEGRKIVTILNLGHLYSPTLGRIKFKEKSIINKADGSELESDKLFDLGTCHSNITTSSKTPAGKITIDGVLVDIDAQ
jgi:hypothetical protein